MINHYTIMGVPEAVVRQTNMSRKMQDAYTIRRLNYLTQITTQHDDKPLLKGPIDLQAIFYFPVPSGKPKRHMLYPPLMNLLRFFDDIARGVIYEETCSIYSVTLIKKYELGDPRSEFTFECEDK